MKVVLIDISELVIVENGALLREMG